MSDAPDKKYWAKELDAARSRFESYWSRCDKIEKKYLGDSDQTDFKSIARRRFNVLWTNEQVLRPAIFSQLPQVACKRYHQSDDQTSNLAAQILTNALTYNADVTDALAPALRARDNLTLFARGVLWAIYHQDATDEQNQYECVKWIFLPRKWFMHSAAERWEDVWWLARKIMMDREDAAQKYPDQSFDLYALEQKKEEEIEFWQIWSKRHNKVFTYCARSEHLVDAADPPITLDGFFPCPRPAFGTLGDETMIPVPDFVYYEDESNDIDDMMTRVSAILSAVKTRGVYDERFRELRDLFNQPDNGMVPVKDFDDFMTRGGLKGVMDLMPTDQLVAVVRTLIEMIANKLDVIYQKTGISDIQRSLSDPSETLGAQRLKANYGHVRLRDKRKEMARLVRDMFKITAEIQCELFSETSLQLASGAMIVPAPIDPQARKPLAFPECYSDDFAAAVQLLRTQWLRQYKIDVETDSTVAADEAETLRQITQMLDAIGGYLSQSVSVAQAAPPMVPVMAEGLKMLARSFRPAARLEQLLDNALDQIVQQSRTPPPAPGPTREEVELEKLQLQAIDQQGDMALKTAELRMKEQQHQADLLIKQKTAQQKDQEIALEAAQERRLSTKEAINAAAGIPL